MNKNYYASLFIFNYLLKSVFRPLKIKQEVRRYGLCKAAVKNYLHEWNGYDIFARKIGNSLLL